MELSLWMTFVAVAFLIAISPGSGAVLSMSHGLAYGVRRASVTIWGLQAGLLAVLLIAGAGVGSLLLASELAFSIVKTVGALYLIYLGFMQWRSKPSTDASGQLTPSQIPSLPKRFLIGFFTNATNPKGIIFMVAVLPQFIIANMPLLPQLAILAITMMVIDLTVMHSYAFLAAALQNWLRDARALQLQNRVFGGLLMAVGASLFLVKRGAQAS